MTYNTFKMIHTVIGGLLLGGGVSFLVWLASLRASGNVFAFKVFAHWNIRLFWLLGLPLFVFQIVLALILISLKTPALSSHLIGTLFLEFFLVLGILLGSLFYLKTRFVNLYHHRLRWLFWSFCLILTGFVLGLMVYKMAEIGLQTI